jgi:esterase
LLTNLYRDGQQFKWRMNLRVLQHQYEQIAAAPSGDGDGRCTTPTLFIKGERSDYIQPQYRNAIETLFPNAQARVMAGVGHWPHAEKPKAFNALVSRFLAK